jgi:plastocyanin
VPQTVSVKQGDTVVWVNKDPFAHTATAQDRSFGSREIAADKTWKCTVRKKGTIPYVCTFRPTMKGTLVVK